MEKRSTQTISNLVQLLTLIIFISLVSTGIGCTYLLARTGLGFHTALTIKTISLFLLFINGPIFPIFLKRKDNTSTFDPGSYAFGLLFLIGLSGFLGMIHPAYGLVSISTAIVFLGVTAFIANLFLLLRKTSLRFILTLAGLSACFTLWLSGRLWGSQIIHPLFFEALSTGKGYIDTLFHISISQMIHTYGVASTGVDGLAALRYHVGSHWLIAQWANLLGVTVFDFFILVYSAVLMPLFYFTILLLAIRLSELFSHPFILNLREQAGRTFWVLFFVLTIRILPDRALANLAIWETFDFSPSQFMGLSLFFLIIVIGLDYWNHPNNWVRIALSWTGIPFALVLLGWMKNSVLILAMAGYGFVLLRQGRLRRPAGWIALALAAFVSLWTLITVTNFGVGNSGIRLFAFLRTYIPFHLLPYHLIVYFGFLIFYTIIRITQAEIFSIASIRTAFRHGKVLDIEILFLITFLGILPGLFLMIPNGSAHYFSNIQIRLAIPFILAQSGWIAQRFLSSRIKGRRIVVLIIIFILGWKTASLAALTLKGNLALRKQLNESSLTEKRTQFLARLQKIDLLPLAEKKRMLIHVSRTDKIYWNDFLDREPKQKISFVVPAVSGIVMLDGLPPDSINAPNYGFSVYQKREQHPERQAGYCRAARALGFEDPNIISFTFFEDAPNIIHCDNEELPE